jgi:hypothetical protein
MNIEDFNDLDFKSLIKLPGIGKGTANRILLYKTKYQFNSSKDLLKIKGIGRNTLIKLGIDLPEKKRKKSRREKIQEMLEHNIFDFSMAKCTPFTNLPYNSKIAFYEDLVKDTCHRPDLVQSSAGCNNCPYVLLCNCRLRNFVSERGKRGKLPTKKVQKELYDNIDSYYHYKATNGEVNYSKLDMPEL